MNEAQNLIEFKNITRTYKMGKNSFQALKGVSFTIKRKELVAIIGPSGSGKSTTMHIMGLLDTATAGQYFLNDKDITTLSNYRRAQLRNREIGFIFQSFFLLPRLTAERNVCLPLLYRGVSLREARERALAMLERVGMKKHAHHRPNELSGGQQQRVAIARALVGSPSLILADEPTGALDQKTGHDVLNLLKELNEKDGATVVIITHDIKIANECQRKIPIVDGHLVQEL